MQLYRTEDSLCQKISSSIKKSHKISILSKKQGRSPKKIEVRQGGGRGVEQGGMMGSVGGGNGSARQGGYSNNMTGNRNHNASTQQSSKPTRIMSQQHSYPTSSNTVPNNATNQFDHTNIFAHYPSHLKKANTISYQPTSNNAPNQHLTNQAYNYPYQQIHQPQNKSYQNQHNISQMIQKQVQSQVHFYDITIKQVNNQFSSITQLQTSFLTGNRVGSNSKRNLKGSGSGNYSVGGLENRQEAMLVGVMQIMHQQIKVAKEKYQLKIIQVMKDNVRQIQELREKLKRNQKMLKDKEKELQGLRAIIKRGQAEKRKIMSQGQINVRVNDNPNSTSNNRHKTPQPQKAHNYYRTRIHDLQSKLKLLIPQQTPNIQPKLQLLQTQLLTYHSAKLSSLQSLVNGFVTSRESRLFEMRQFIEASVGQLGQKLGLAREQNDSQVKLVNEVQRKVKSVEGEVREFIGKQWKYENYAVQQVKREVQQFKEKLRYFQSMQFENAKLTAKLTEELNKLKIDNIDTKQNIQTTQTISATQPLTSLSNINQTASKYTLTNNISKISLSDLSNTHQYSHLLEKMTPGENVAMSNDNGQVLKFNRQKSPLQSNLNNQSQSLISMSFTEEAAESVRQPLKSSIKSPFDQQSYNAFNQQEQPSKYSYEQQFVPAQQMSKLTKTTDLKDTMAQISPQRPTKYYVPSQTRTIPSQVINDTSTKQKIGRLNELKMQNLRDGSSFTSSVNGKIPNKPTQKNPPEGKSPKHSHLYLDNNTSHWSISQLEDYNMSRDIPMSQITDFSDDEFFYLQGMTQEEYVKRKGYLNTPVKTQGSIQQSPMRKKFAAEEEFSPMAKKMVATEQNFYNPQLSLQKNGHNASNKRQPKASRQKNSFLYNSSFDFQKFSSDQDQPSSQPKPNNLYSSNSPTPKQNFTHNQHSILQHIHNLPKSQLPIKVIYDRKKCEGIFKLSIQNHSLNGKAFTLALHQLQKLQSLGYLAVRTYV